MCFRAKSGVDKRKGQGQFRAESAIYNHEVNRMSKSLKTVLVCVLIIVVLFCGLVWVLTQTLGSHETMYQGKSLDYWHEMLNGRDVAASNQANVVLTSVIIPQLTNQMFHDTNDSSFRLALVDKLNCLPGVVINYIPADRRRATAVDEIGEFGPLAKDAIPVLIQALKGKDGATRPAAARVLGKIHGDPDVVIPLLIDYLSDDDVNASAAEALGDFGPPAKAAVPKLVPLLKPGDKDLLKAVTEALRKIGPEASAEAKPKNRE
jgi:HEAT repeats